MSSGSQRVVLNEVQIEDALTELDGWEYKGNRLERTIKTGSFQNGVDLVLEIAPVANAMNHHPDIFLTYPRVKIQLWTHDVNGITKLDLELAGRINAIAVSQGLGY